jgi:hypothetical protein
MIHRWNEYENSITSMVCISKRALVKVQTSNPYLQEKKSIVGKNGENGKGNVFA